MEQRLAVHAAEQPAHKANARRHGSKPAAGDNINRNELVSEITSEWSEKTVSKWEIQFINVQDLPDLKLKDILSL